MISFLLFLGAENIIEQALSEHLLNDCWALVTRWPDCSPHLREGGNYSPLVHFTAMDTRRHGWSSCPNPTLPQLHPEEEGAGSLWACDVQQYMFVFITWDNACLRNTLEKAGIDGYKTSSLHWESHCVVWDERNHFILLFNSSLNACSNGNLNTRHTSLHVAKELREMPFNA